MLRNWKVLLLCAPLLIAACSKDDDNPPPATGGNNPPPQSTGLIGVEDLHLLQFSPAAPGTIQGEVALTGFDGEGGSSPPFVIAIDFRVNGVLYVLMSDNKLYTANTSTGVMTLVGPLAVDTGVVLRTFNWDPVRDRIRALGSNRENYDFNPDGTLAGRDSDLQYASGDAHQADTPSVEAVSYPGGAGATTTTAYGIDATLDTLVTIGTVGDATSQDSGQVHTVGNLTQPVGGAGSPPFDIDPRTSNPAVGYLTDSDGTQTHAFRVDLATGALTDLGEVGTDRRIQALSVAPGGSGVGGQTGGGNPPPPPPGTGGEEICSTPITDAGATVEVLANDPNCVGCQVYNPQFVVDTDPDSFATFDLQAGLLLGGVAVRVHAAPGTTYPSGRIAGGLFNFPGADLIAVAVAPDLTITTLVGDDIQESVTLGGDTIVLDVAHGVVNGDKFFAGFTTTKPFDSVEIKPDVGVVGVFTRLNMYSACAGSVDEGTFP